MKQACFIFPFIFLKAGDREGQTGFILSKAGDRGGQPGFILPKAGNRGGKPVFVSPKAGNKGGDLDLFIIGSAEAGLPCKEEKEHTN